MAGCAQRPPPLPVPPSGVLSLDAARPVIAVSVAGVPLLLRVDPGQWDVVELNAGVAARLSLAWSGDRDMEIGRTSLEGQSAQSVMEVAGRKLPVLVARHGRVAAADADGVVGPDILPYAEIRWRRAAAPAATGEIAMPITLEERTGLTATPPGLDLPIRLRFSLMRPTSEATAAAGSLLVRRQGGHFVGPAEPLPILFGITRPARPLAFDRAPLLAGFRFPRLLVRIADFRGDNPLPSDPVAAGEIVVAGKDRPQHAEPWVTIAADRLTRCAEITYRAVPLALTLACVFDR